MLYWSTGGTHQVWSQATVTEVGMRKPRDFSWVLLQVSSSLSCPLRCVPPARIVVNAAVRRLIQRLHIGPATHAQHGPPPTQQIPAGKPWT